MTIKIIKLAMITVLASCTFWANGVNASSSFPEFSLSSQNESKLKNEEVSPVQINIKNQLMRDVLLLQEQINLLEAMVERQGEIQKIASSYSEINVPFTQPSPPSEACQRLPSNILCLYSYPDMESNKDYLDNIFDNYADFTTAQNVDLGLGNIDIEPDLTIPQEERLPEEIYVWTDIQCLQNNCTAVIVKDGDSSERLRVKVGDVVSDNLKVSSITPSGLNFIDDKNNIVLIKPEGVRSRSEDDSMDTSEISQILDDTAVELESSDDNVPEIEITPPQSVDEQLAVENNDEVPQSDVLTSTGLF